MDLKKLTDKRLLDYWNVDNNQATFKYAFGLRLAQYAYGKHFDYTTEIIPENHDLRTEIIESYRKRTSRGSSREKQFNRLLLGYYGIHKNLTPKICGLSSVEANKKNMPAVNDHVIGVTSCSDYIKDEFKKGFTSENWINMKGVSEKIEYMCNDWLPEHLWLWVQCRITREEHKADNLSRGNKYSVEEKRNLLHYKKAGIILERYI